MRRQNQHARELDELFHPLRRLGDEQSVAGRQPFVEQQDFRHDAGGSGKSQPNAHARRIGANRHVQIVAELGERGDLVDALAHVARVDAHIHAAQDDVLLAGHVGVHADIDVEERRDPSRSHQFTPAGTIDAGQYLEQRGLAGAVEADQADPIALLDAEIEVVERAHVDAVERVAREIAARRVGDDRFFQRPRAALIHRKVDAQIVQAKKRHRYQTQ